MGVSGTREAKPTVLVVDDDLDFSTYLTEVLRRSGTVAYSVPDGVQAMKCVKRSRPSLVILDLGLPYIDGTSLVEIFRYEWELPVVVVSGRASMPDVVSSLDHGADDYLIKPVRSEELVARVRAVLRRANAWLPDARSPRFEAHDFGEMQIDVASKKVTLRGEAVRLTPKEFDLLVYLARHAGQTVERREILEAVWHSTPNMSASSTVNEHVRRLRRKLEDDPNEPRWVVTETGFGYRFDPSPVTSTPLEPVAVGVLPAESLPVESLPLESFPLGSVARS